MNHRSNIKRQRRHISSSTTTVLYGMEGSQSKRRTTLPLMTDIYIYIYIIYTIGDIYFVQDG